jgi:predicted Zn-dependent peptidase
VGDISMPELQVKLEAAFGKWTRGGIPAKNIAAVNRTVTPTIYLLDRPGAEQSVIMAGQLIPSKSHSDDLPFDLFNDTFGGSFVSRLNMNLREAKHWSYGASSFNVDARGERPWMLIAPVQTDKTGESVQEAIRELRTVLNDKPISANELAAAKDRNIKTLAGRWETGSSVVAALGEIAVFGLPEDHYATYSSRVAAATEAQVNAAGRTYLQPDKLVWVVVGDRAKIESGIRALGFGTIVLLDADGNVKR